MAVLGSRPPRTFSTGSSSAKMSRYGRHRGAGRGSPEAAAQRLGCSSQARVTFGTCSVHADRDVLVVAATQLERPRRADYAVRRLARSMRTPRRQKSSGLKRRPRFGADMDEESDSARSGHRGFLCDSSRTEGLLLGRRYRARPGFGGKVASPALRHPTCRADAHRRGRRDIGRITSAADAWPIDRARFNATTRLQGLFVTVAGAPPPSAAYRLGA